MVRVSAGSEAFAQIRFDAEVHTPPVRVRLSGTLTVPEAWRGDVEWMWFDALGETRAWVPESLRSVREFKPTEQPRTWRWKAPRPIPAGEYKVTVNPFHAPMRVKVPPVEEHQVALRLPEPANVALRVVDADGDLLPVNDLDLSWWIRPEPGLTAYSFRSTEGDDGTYRFQMPPGQFSVGGKAKDYETERLEVQVFAGTNELTLSTAVKYSIMVKYSDGVRDLPPRRRWDFEVEPAAGSHGRSLSRYPGSQVWVSGPGTYVIKFASMEDYQPVPDRVVEVAGPGATEIEVRLKR